ncbi:glycine zipper 2TM domain-containing protein [Deefgea rivuli]|uniref:glycine zipper 2TM domain-containing protein n=1 Tax=Deefgea rivuli TaxID=400948 RepID=UPI00068720F4|nr:glycine zipper 2TM domain-containing protein [Deefgea rivuli]
MCNPKLMLILASLFIVSTAQASDLKTESAQINANYKSDLKVCMEFEKSEQADCKKDAATQRQAGFQALWNKRQGNEALPVYQGDLASQKKQIEADYQLMLSMCKELDKATQPTCKTEATNRKKASLKTAMNAPASSDKKAICATCGVVTQVLEVEKPGEGTWMGKIGGAAVGVGLGSLIGKGKGKTAAMVVGGLGGAYAGNKVEGAMNDKKYYEVSVKLDDGSTQTVTFDNPNHGYKQGDKVKLENKQLVKR